MDFYMDKKKQKRIIKEKRQKLTGTGKGLVVIGSIVKVVSVFPMIWAIVSNLRQRQTDMIESGIFWTISFILSVIILTVALSLDSVVRYRYLAVWGSNKYSELHLGKNGVEFGTYTVGTGDYYRTYYFDYSDIVDLEYDRENYLFRITGKYVNKTWLNVNRTSLSNEHEKTVEIKTVTFLEAFNKFDDFVIQIQKRTGLEVKNIPIKL